MNNKQTTIKTITFLLVALLCCPFLVNAARTAGGDTLPSQTGNNGKYLTTDGSSLSWATASGTGDVVGPASSTDNAITRFDSTTGKLLQNSNWTIDDNGLMSASISTEQGFSLISSLGAGSGNNLMYLETTSTSWDRPILRINNAGTSGGATNIRLDGPAPQMELVETDQIGTDGSGKFEIGVNGDIFYISGRNSANTSFEDTVKVDRQINGGGIRLYGSTTGYTKIKGPATGTSKTLTLPDITGTLSTLAGTETFTNKTISGASNTITNIDLSSSVNLTAGRSLTLTGDDVAADAELYTDTKCIYFESPTATDDFKSIWLAKQAATLTSIWAESDQTVTFMLQVDDGTPADVDTVDLAPAAGTAEDTSLNGDTTMASGDRLDIDLVSVSGTPTWVSICWTFAYDD